METPSAAVHRASRRLPLLFVVALAMAFAQPARAISLVDNGGFEQGFTGWTQFGNTSNTSVTGSGGAAYAGSFGGKFGPTGGSGVGGVFQTLSTTPGGLYDLTFWLANTGNKSGNSFSVSWNGVAIQATVLSGSSSFGYTLFTVQNLVATGNSTELRFTFREKHWYLDEVSVTAVAMAVPEALSGLWLALPFGGMVLWHRLRKRAGQRSAAVA